MCDSYDTTLILWPATTLAASVAEELRSSGVDLTGPQDTLGWLPARRTEDGELLLEITREHPHGLTDLEAVLARLRLVGVSYVAWDVKKSEVAGTCRSYDRNTRVEREFTVMADGEPVLTLSDLEELDGHHANAEALVQSIRAWLRLALPENLRDVHAFTITIEPDDSDDEESS